MNLQRIVPFLYLYTPLGEAEAYWIQVPEDGDTYAFFVCFQKETKECWVWPNPHVRLVDSISSMRGKDHSPIHISDSLFETMKPHILRHKKSPFYERAAQAR